MSIDVVNEDLWGIDKRPVYDTYIKSRSIFPGITETVTLIYSDEDALLEDNILFYFFPRGNIHYKSIYKYDDGIIVRSLFEMNKNSFFDIESIVGDLRLESRDKRRGLDQTSTISISIKRYKWSKFLTKEFAESIKNRFDALTRSNSTLGEYVISIISNRVNNNSDLFIDRVYIDPNDSIWIKLNGMIVSKVGTKFPLSDPIVFDYFTKNSEKLLMSVAKFLY